MREAGAPADAYVILDIEWNGAFTRGKASSKAGRYFNEIIEIGAVRLCSGADGRPVVSDSFQAAIKPVVSRKLSALVKELTGIEEGDLSEGRTFAGAMSRLKRWIGEGPCIVMTWSTTDLLVLLENCRYFFREERIPFLTAYADLQDYFQRRRDIQTGQQVGLGRACELMDIETDSLSQHRALDDSKLAAEVFRAVYEPESFRAAAKPADEEFYSRLTFKTSYIRDLDSPLLKKEWFRFSCEECGHRLRPADSEKPGETDWRRRNNAFFAKLSCRRCGRLYTARVQVKLKYDGPVVSRRMTDAAEETTTGEDTDGQAETDR